MERVFRLPKPLNASSWIYRSGLLCMYISWRQQIFLIEAIIKPWVAGFTWSWTLPCDTRTRKRLLTANTVNTRYIYIYEHMGQVLSGEPYWGHGVICGPVLRHRSVADIRATTSTYRFHISYNLLKVTFSKRYIQGKDELIKTNNIIHTQIFQHLQIYIQYISEWNEYKWSGYWCLRICDFSVLTVKSRLLRAHSSNVHYNVRRIYRWPGKSPHKGQVTQNMFPFDDVIKGWRTTWKFENAFVLEGHIFIQLCLFSFTPFTSPIMAHTMQN